MAYTSGDFEVAIEAARASALKGSPYIYDDIAFIALRIAANATRTGVIEGAVPPLADGIWNVDVAPSDLAAVAAAIRKALTVVTVTERKTP